MLADLDANSIRIRLTDDGVKAAKGNPMAEVTGYEYRFHHSTPSQRDYDGGCPVSDLRFV